MQSFRALSRLLGSLESEIRASTPFVTIGLVTPSADGFVRFEARNEVTASAVYTRLALVPAMLRPLLDAPCTAAVHDFGVPATAPVARFMSMFGLDVVCAVPIAVDGGAVLFGAGREAVHVADAAADALAVYAARLSERARLPEPVAETERRLRRLDALAEMLPVLSTALDVRAIFGHLSTIARRVLPHDLAVVGLNEDDDRRIRLYALSNLPGVPLPEFAANPYPETFEDGWEFALYRNLQDHPLEGSRTAVRVGMRSALRVPIRINGRLTGVLSLSSFTPGQFGDEDVPIAERLMEAVTVALSHHRLAQQAEDAEKLRERAANLDMLEQLLETLAGVLDVREVLDRVSAIAHKVLPHDAMSVPIVLDDPPRLRVHALSGLASLPPSFEAPMPEPKLLTEPWDHLILDFADRPLYAESVGAQAGMQSVLCLPVRLEGRLFAAVNFYSRSKGAFTAADVPIGRRIADHVALAFSHQRLVEEARRSGELRSATASAEVLDELLAAETSGADQIDVFDRISTIARKVLPHDTMVLAVALPDGRRVRIHVRGGNNTGFPEVMEIPDAIVSQPGWEYDLIDDLQQVPAHRYLNAARLGYRSTLRVPLQLENRYAGALIFFAFEPARYKQSDVMIARRIADRVTLVLARDRGLEATRRAEEATARAARLEARVRALTEELDARTGLRRVIGESVTWRQVLLQATRVAATDTTVLLLGESGTGKEIVARFIHRASERNRAPFIALNCAALPEHLLEAELFGFERGAFTGATQSKPGQLEQAAGGTLFLDEVGEMSLPAQAKFLRVLQEREFQRLGGTRVLKADARIIAATNRDLEKAMSQNTFREDLFYRLNVFAIHLPPLRDRREDILPLSDAFLSEIGRGLGRPPGGIARDAREKLVGYHWPGNVRELRNVLERAAILCDGGLVTADHLAFMEQRVPAIALEAPASHAAPSAPAPAQAVPAGVPPAAAGELKAMERALIEQALQKARFNKSKAAKALGLTRAQLYVRMRRYGLD